MSNTIDVSQVLAQIRALSAQAGARPAAVPNAVPATGAAAAPPTASFATLASKAIDEVNTQQQAAGKLQNSFELGDPSVDLASVMLASTKAQVSFRGMVEVRNRLVSAYQEVMNLPL
jgi:flagellar hook-basal body complex protein FliE